MRMGNQPSQIESRALLHGHNTRGSRHDRNPPTGTTATVLPDRTIGRASNEPKMNIDVNDEAESWMSETGTIFSGAPSPTEKSTPCPTEIPPPRTMDAARKMLARLCVVFRQRDLEVQGLVGGLGGLMYDRSCDGNLVYELRNTGYELGYLTGAVPRGENWGDEGPVAWSPKLVGDIFAVLDGYGRVIEEIVEMCGKLREAQTGERLPGPSDLDWLKKNIAPDATKFAARLKHLTARSQVLRFDIDQEISGMLSVQ